MGNKQPCGKDARASFRLPAAAGGMEQHAIVQRKGSLVHIRHVMRAFEEPLTRPPERMVEKPFRDRGSSHNGPYVNRIITLRAQLHAEEPPARGRRGRHGRIR